MVVLDFDGRELNSKGWPVRVQKVVHARSGATISGVVRRACIGEATKVMAGLRPRFVELNYVEKAEHEMRGDSTCYGLEGV